MHKPNAKALKVTRLNLAFGGLKVTQNLTLSLREGERHALIGPNGAGKTTLLNLITGELSPDSGDIELQDRSVIRLSVDERARAGLVRTFQRNNLLDGLTVIENLEMAERERLGVAGRIWISNRQKSAIRETARGVLCELGLDNRAEILVGNLAYGEQRLVEIANALIMRPAVLLLDEPAAGVAPANMSQILDVLEALPRSIAILLIEHDMKIVFKFAEIITVLCDGAILREGTPNEIENDAEVRAAYLGQSFDR